MNCSRRLVSSFGLAAAIGLAASLASAQPAGPEVAYPDGYRSWTHIKSGWIGEGNPAFLHFGGMHHIYANGPALTGFRTGTYPVGSVLDVLATKAGTGSLETTERRLRDVMEKNAAGWRFTEFKGDSHTERSVTTADAVKACAACHEAAKRDHVFSAFADGAGS